MAHDSGLRRAGLAFALFAGFSLLPSYAASSQISPEACSAAPCTIPNVFDPDLADVKAFNNQALADLVQAIKVGHNNNDHTCYPTAASITIHSPTYQIKGLPPSSLGDERAKALINYLTGQGLVQNADFDLSSSIDQANKVDVNFNGVDRDPPKFYSLKSNPPKGTKVKAGDRIAVTITASERHEDGHKSTPTGVKTVQVRADDGLIEPIGNYSPQPCERRSLDVNYMVPSNPPSIIHLQVVVEDAVGNQDFRTAEFPTGDWYGTLTGHHKGGWANHATVVQFNFSEKPGGTIEGRGRVAVTSEKWASASCKGTTTTPPDINISIGGRRVGDQFQLELENPILSGTISSICQGTSGTSPWRASLSALLAESVRPQVAARDGATNERHKQIGYFNSDAKIELHRARSN